MARKNAPTLNCAVERVVHRAALGDKKMKEHCQVAKLLDHYMDGGIQSRFRPRTHSRLVTEFWFIDEIAQRSARKHM